LGIQAPRLYRKQTGVFFVRVLGDPGHFGPTPETPERQNKRELKRSLRTKNPKLARSISSYLNALVESVPTEQREDVVDHFFAHTISTWTLPGGVSCDDDDDQDRLERLPESVDARAKVFAEATWAIAFKEAQAVFDRAKQLTEGEVDRSKQALTSSIAINEQLESQCNALELRLKSVESDLLEARVNLRQVDELKVELAETRECVEKHRQDCESLNQVVATLRGENSVLRDQGQQLLARVTLAKPRSRAAAGRANKSTS